MINKNTTNTPDSPKDFSDLIEGDDLPKQAIDNYPLDNLLIRTETRAIIDVLRRIDQGMVFLDPDFQRDFIWKEERQSRLVESVLMRIPLPVFYLAENTAGRLVVVDGLQRLSTLNRFHANELILSLPNSNELNSKTFKMLTQKLQNRFEDGQLTLYLIDPRVPDRVQLDIFERVNSGVPLTRQQMRNALYNGPATKLLRDLSSCEDFLNATDNILLTENHKSNMRDREVVNRFLAFQTLGWAEYVKRGTGDIDEFLGSALKQINNSTETQRSELEKSFRKSMRINHHLFGNRAFRKYSAPSERRKPFNIALFDVLSVVFAKYKEAQILSKAPEVKRTCENLMNQREYHNAISYATTSPENVKTRFHQTETALRGVVGDP
ncbi:hypothetical protein KH5H1_01450 [Corallococcus caeni]|uniref:DUF262 domain-containing protein n=1 Tax=Corallococcus caeni TaxID=3082388 RepID=UPI002957652E|nr:hypothetical protein KH5H1_01450 [Corallococcus sp. KH5-1]